MNLSDKKILFVVPVKGSSLRCPKKNEFCLPIILDLLKDLGVIKNTIISSDSKKLQKIAKEYGANFCNEKVGGKNKANSIYGGFNGYEKYKHKAGVEYVFLINATYLFTPKKLFSKVLNQMIKVDSKIAIPTQKVPDERYRQFIRESNYIKSDPNFILKDGSSIPKVEKILNCFILFKPEMLIKYKNDLKSFWSNGEIQGVPIGINLPSVEIDTKEDLDFIKSVSKGDFINKIRNINV